VRADAVAIGSAEAQSRLAPPSLKAQTFTPLSRAFDCRERFFLQKSSTLLSLNVKCPFLMSSPSSVRNLSVIIVAIELQKPNRNWTSARTSYWWLFWTINICFILKDIINAAPSYSIASIHKRQRLWQINSLSMNWSANCRVCGTWECIPHASVNRNFNVW